MQQYEKLADIRVAGKSVEIRSHQGGSKENSCLGGTRPATRYPRVRKEAGGGKGDSVLLKR